MPIAYDFNKIVSGLNEMIEDNVDCDTGERCENWVVDMQKYKRLERKSIHSIKEIRELTKDVLFEKYKQNAKVKLDGDLIKGNSQRLQTFFTRGMKCACCGIEGKYFAKEKDCNAVSYHLNLYAIDDNGKEVLMTKDHIIPRSKGGKNCIGNYQTMCVYCNMEKGNKFNKLKN